MMTFAGFDMPVQYSGIIEEHMAVRQAAGLFDVSHMGEVLVQGPEAFGFVQHLVTNDATRLYDGRAMYTVMCTPEGGIVDDLLVYRLNDRAYMLVINASNIEGDFAWMQANNPMGGDLQNISDEVGLIALQGPQAFAIARRLTGDFDPEQLKFYHFAQMPAGAFFGCEHAILSHTGYTGEPGLEIYCDADRAGTVWDAIMTAGADLGLKPAGLGARDTLRLESGFCLYGSDIDATTNPLEAGLGWLTRLDKGPFIGREALQAVKEHGPARKLVGFVMNERGIPRHGCAILDSNGDRIGEVTSGSLSPILGKGVGLGYVATTSGCTTSGQTVLVDIRGKHHPATVTRPPFYKN